jgi:multicomponent Na+:H+ antiporter subunit B
VSAPPGDDRPHSPYDRRTTVVARTVARLVVPVILMTAVALLLQGHNLPGGGFVGAVLTVTALVLVYVVFGAAYLVETVGADGERLVGAYRALFAVGLGVAFVSGLAPMGLGGSFLSQAVFFVDGLPLYGELEVASALAFDLGVYLTVVGALLVVVSEVGDE